MKGTIWGRGHLNVIGVGPAGPHTATLQALDTIKQMDVILAPEQQLKLFTEYVGDTPVLFDPWEGMFDYNGKQFNELSKEEMDLCKTERVRIRDQRVAEIMALLEQGRDVGLLEYGNPCLFGPSHWYIEQFKPHDVIIIPGMGNDAAAMAALGKSTIPAHDARFVVQTAPMFLMNGKKEDLRILEDLNAHPVTMILYMALWNSGALFRRMGEVLPPDMPCAVVFWAGHPERQKIVRGTVENMGEKLARIDEKFMGLLLIGRFLDGNPYTEALKGVDHHVASS